MQNKAKKKSVTADLKNGERLAEERKREEMLIINGRASKCD